MDVLKVSGLKKRKARRRKPLETNEEIRQALRKYIPALGSGAWEIVAMARVVGRRCLVAVHPTSSNEAAGELPRLSRGPELNAMIEELAGEFPSVYRWNESAEEFVRRSFLGPELKVTITGAKAATVTLNKRLFDEMNGRRPKVTRDPVLRLHSEMVQLVSEVTGWRISLEVVGEV